MANLDAPISTLRSRLATASAELTDLRTQHADVIEQGRIAEAAIASAEAEVAAYEQAISMLGGNTEPEGAGV